jgi:hypothetical protein
VDESAADEVARPLPVGTPIRASEWIAPPFLLIGYAVVVAVLAADPDAQVSQAYALAAVPLMVASAVALWASGFLAYRNVDVRSAERYLTVAAGALFVTGALLATSRFPAGVVSLAVAGLILADRKYRPVRVLRGMVPARRWRRTAVVAAVIAVLSLVAEPLAFGLGRAPLIVLVVAGRILAPAVFGLAWGFRRVHARDLRGG